MTSSSLDSYFNLGALFIMFREVLEAVVIVTILLQLCTKLGAHRLKKWGEHSPPSQPKSRAIIRQLNSPVKTASFGQLHLQHAQCLRMRCHDEALQASIGWASKIPWQPPQPCYAAAPLQQYSNMYHLILPHSPTALADLKLRHLHVDLKQHCRH